jgi:glutamyl-tRNA(Gln) amidotransferase subunit E
MDEEPPHALDEEALDVCLTVALMVKSRPLDEVHVMRKVVIDGSNTTGFQRTCVVAVGGEVEVQDRRIPLQALYLEEDAARKVAEQGVTLRYRLDRLCIPLIEIATAPTIRSPEEAEATAQALGRVLRSTGRVRRGLGTIRQDLNISIRGGALVEIKGVQDLSLISKVLENEVRRQLALLDVRRLLAERGASLSEAPFEPVEVSGAFQSTACQVLRMALAEGQSVLALGLPGFGELLGRELIPGLRLGTEFADYAKFGGGIGWLFHSDELPAYGVTAAELDRVRAAVHAGEADAVVLLAGDRENAVDALRAVLGRARTAVSGVPSETRGAKLDGTTRFARPRPGAARMYPETDVPPVPISADRLTRLAASLPEPYETRLSRLMGDYALNKKLASQLLDSDYLAVFASIANATDIATTFVAATLTETFKRAKREGVSIDALPPETIEAVFTLADDGVIAKEAVMDVLCYAVEHRDVSLEEVVERLDVRTMTVDALRRVVDRTVDEHRALIAQRGKGALGALMGVIMKQYSGRVDPARASALLVQRIDAMTTGR